MANFQDYNTYNQNEKDVVNVGAESGDRYLANYMSKVYGWMFVGLAITALVAFWTVNNEAMLNYLVTNRMLFFGLMIGELFIVGFLVVRVHKLSVPAATALFFLYAAINGITISLLLLIYTMASVVTTFAITAGTFGIMSIVGFYTKQDLTSFGKLLFMALIGIILASIVNFFLKSPAVYWIVTYVGVAVFVGLIAYDTQKIKSYAYLEDEESKKKGAIMGALALYLDFINLFIMLLRLFGRRN